MSVQLDDRLQSVLNAVARPIFTARRTDHFSPLLTGWTSLSSSRFIVCVLA